MVKKGLVHVVALIVISLLFTGTISLASVSSERSQKEAVGKVLSDSDQKDDDGEDRQEEGENGKESESDKKPVTSRGPGSANTSKVESKSGGVETKVETRGGKTKIEIKNREGEFKSELEDGKEETKLELGKLKIVVKSENGRVVFKIKNEQGEEVEVDDEDESEVLEELDDELEGRGVEIATDSARPGFIQNGRRVRTNFPLTVNVATGELFVTTPAGEKVVAILPEQAIANMIRAGVLTRVVQDSTPTPTPEATASASTESAIVTIVDSGIVLSAVNGEPVYEIVGVKNERLIGVFPVGIKKLTVVSATSGNLLDVNVGFFARILDFLSI